MTQSVVVVKQKLEGVDLQNKTTFISVKTEVDFCVVSLEENLKTCCWCFFVLFLFMTRCDGKVMKSNFRWIFFPHFPQMNSF